MHEDCDMHKPSDYVFPLYLALTQHQEIAQRLKEIEDAVYVHKIVSTQTVEHLRNLYSQW